MRTKLRLLAALALMTTMPYALTACGGSDIECGANTTEEDGKCVAKVTGDSVTCSAGTTLTDGKCEADLSSCGEGTEEQEGECVATGTTGNPADTCGTGTQYDTDAKECVPTSTITCGTGTTEENGACVPTNTSTLECGTGTVEENGECVSTVMQNDCGTGTTADANGDCIVDAAACGEGTELDPNTNICVASEACGPNTAIDTVSGLCVPTDTVCDVGTTYSADTGLCLPDATCRMGDVILNGVCVSAAEDAFANADYTSTEAADRVANNDDLLFGGTSNTFTLAAQGTQFNIAGAIESPVDIDGDLVEDQDVDFYTFTATAGQTIQVAVQPIKGPSLAFAVVETSVFAGGAPLTQEEIFERYSTFGLGNGAARSVVIPEDGDYVIVVAPAIYLAQGFFGGPSGQDDWRYVLSVEEIAPYTAIDVDPATGPITGDFVNLSDNLYKLINYTGGPATLTIDDIGSDIEGAKLSIWTSPTALLGTYDISEGDTESLALPSGDVYFFFDWTYAYGRDTGFEVTFTPVPVDGDLGALVGGTATSTTADTFAADQSRLYTFSATSGTILEITQTNTEEAEVDLEIKNSTGDLILQESFFGATTANGNVVTYVYLDQTGDYTLQVTNSDDTDAITNTSVSINPITPDDLGAIGVGGTLSSVQTNIVAEGYSEFRTFTLSENVTLTGTLFDDGNGVDGTGNADITIIDLSTFGVVISENTSGDESFSGLLLAGTYLVNITATTELTNGYTFTADATTPPALEVEPNDDVASATDLGSLPFDVIGTGGYANGGGAVEFTTINVPFDYFTFDLAADMAPGDRLEITLETIASFEASGAPIFVLYDAAQVEIARSAGPATLVFNDLVAGDYTIGIAVSFTTGFDTQYRLSGQLIPFPATYFTISGDSINNSLPDVVSTLNVPDACVITDIEVAMDISHTYKGDIIMDLTSPAGTTVKLHNETGGSADDIQGVYRIAADDLVSAEDLTQFLQEQAQGDWVLTIDDTFNGDDGTLNIWGLNFTCAP